MQEDPARKLSAVIHRLREIPIGAPYSEVALQRDRKEIEALIDQFPARAHSVLGIIATILGNEEVMRRHFEAAREIEPDSTYIRINYIVGLQGFGCFSEALLEIRDACKDHSKDPDLLGEAVFASVHAGRFQEAEKWLQARERVAPNAEPLVGMEGIVACCRFLREKRISDQEVESLQLQVAALLRENHILGPVIEYDLREDEVDRWLSFRFRLRQSVEEVVRLEWLLADRLADSDISPNALLNLVAGFLSGER
ncbi:MAG: hypothetical protein HQL54_05955 [Magnetococcales bacterium]|nr:hypothetical protein [Magnetococcales bacterium]